MNTAWSITLPLVAGGVGWFANHFFSRSRDRIARRTAFLNQVGHWRTKVYHCHVPRQLSNDFPEDVARFGGAYIALENEMSGDARHRFHALCDQIVAMTAPEVEEVGRDGELVGKAKLLTRIEAVISFFD